MTGEKPNKASALLRLCLIAGTLDAIAALLMSYKLSPATIFQYIASGWFGKAAFTGGAAMVVCGIVFHYLIASFWSIALFHLYPGFKRIVINKYIVAIIFGLIIWLVMNLGVLPLTDVPKHAGGHVNILLILEGIGILTICLGIPIVLIADRYYSKVIH
jgi:hypothetical protein